MFDFDVGKLMVVGIVALAVIPPKDLPRVMRTVGQFVGKMRRMAAEFQGQFMEAMREADLDSVKKEFDALEHAAKVDTSFDPAIAMRDEVTQAIESPKSIEPPKPVEISTAAAEPIEPAASPLEPSSSQSVAKPHSLSEAPSPTQPENAAPSVAP